MSICVYKIENIINHKFYIGSSKNIEYRIKRHFKCLELNKHPNIYLQNSYNKYGKDSFIWSIVELTTLEKLRDREDYFIKTTKCYDRTIGYNIAKGAVCGPDYISDETLEKLKKPKTETHKQNMRKAFQKTGHSKGEKNPNYGKHWSEQWKKDQSKRLKGNEKLAHSPRFYGKTHTNESKNKTSKSLRNTGRNKRLSKLNLIESLSQLNKYNKYLFDVVISPHKDKVSISKKLLLNLEDDSKENNKIPVLIVHFDDSDKNMCIVDEQTFLLMKEALESIDK